MTVRRLFYAVPVVALLSVGASAFAGTSVIVQSNTSNTDPPPTVQIVVKDGTGQVYAGCSEPDCMGSPSIASQLTGTVTNTKNIIGWAIDYGDLPLNLYVDGALVYSQRRVRLITWNVSNLSAGPHTLVATAENSAGVMGSSTPLTIMVVK